MGDKYKDRYKLAKRRVIELEQKLASSDLECVCLKEQLAKLNKSVVKKVLKKVVKKVLKKVVKKKVVKKAVKKKVVKKATRK